MLTADRARELLSYDPETGILTWKTTRKKCLEGSPAGGLCKGYLTIGIDYRRYQYHRVAWLVHHGSWPSADIDHKDGNPLNNRLDNLRDASRSFNLANTRKRKGKALPKGVTKIKSGYRVRLRKDRKTYNVGVYPTVEAAQSAYENTARKMYGEFARFA